MSNHKRSLLARSLMKMPFASFFAKGLFEPRVDFFALLEAQAATTVKGIEALEVWLSGGAYDRCQQVRDFEHQADEQKLVLQKKLVESFVTPLDREDLYDLSVRLDEVINAAKNAAREVEALNYCPRDETLPEMARTLKEGARCLFNSFANLKNNQEEAAAQAALARKAENRFEKIYRQGMRDLFETNDFKTILRTVEVYRTLVTAAQRIDSVAEKLHHVIVKMG
ncbi:MAG: DUF47 family protein [Candidatus Melainabacteria bacterium]|uniref:DUF47 family protein n=1 Tax=Candidatus Obscuribacter phosphatis TaxID=1906157 RepID=A0A8J7PBV9_9BACT|nr:DUF47 family protein [Candidatus Obscuribacter phosphatis]MCA0313042.1 DUF47 family protein [Candidatus Melainabacteria bacterium]OPZ80689.1 MAG: putative pit accessory protein [bacterium ADurb.Bin425]